MEPHLSEGRLPTLGTLLERGASGPLESQIPPWTASAWPSLYTGTNPGKHGVFGFLAFEDYDWDVVDATHVRSPPVWQLLDHHGLRSVVVNVPVTHPPGPFDGALVPGYAAPDPPECHPPGLAEDLREAVPEYRIYPEHEGGSPAREAALAEYRDLAAARGAAFRYLADRFDPDFGFLQFQVTDTVVHEFPGDEDALGTVYGAVDEALSDVLADCAPDTVVVASDHGVGPYGTRVRVNEVLRDADLLAATRGGGMPTWAAVRDSRLRNDDESSNGDRDGLVAGALSVAAKTGLTSQRVGRALEAAGLRDAVLSAVPDRFVRAASERVDFRESAAYVRSRVECGVRLNVAGREPDGVVTPAEYESVRADVVDLLSDLEAPDGDPVFETVAPREEFFHGPEAERAVDVVTVPRNFDRYVTTWLLGDRFAEPDGPAWDHRRTGVVALAGEGVDAGADLADAHLFDVAPTVLALFDCPTRERMDGDVLPAVAPAGERSYPSTVTERDRTGAGEEVADRLADMGYIERP